jgi:hypothetical protein
MFSIYGIIPCMSNFSYIRVLYCMLYVICMSSHHTRHACTLSEFIFKLLVNMSSDYTALAALNCCTYELHIVLAYMSSCLSYYIIQ